MSIHDFPPPKKAGDSVEMTVALLRKAMADGERVVLCVEYKDGSRINFFRPADGDAEHDLACARMLERCARSSRRS